MQWNVYGIGVNIWYVIPYTYAIISWWIGEKWSGHGDWRRVKKKSREKQHMKNNNRLAHDVSFPFSRILLACAQHSWYLFFFAWKKQYHTVWIYVWEHRTLRHIIYKDVCPDFPTHSISGRKMFQVVCNTELTWLHNNSPTRFIFSFLATENLFTTKTFMAENWRTARESFD